MSEEKNNAKRVIMVTGGSGLVGQGIQAVLKLKADVAKLHENDTFIFLTSKDGDLRYVPLSTTPACVRRSVHFVLHCDSRIVYARLHM